MTLQEGETQDVPSDVVQTEMRSHEEDMVQLVEEAKKTKPSHKILKQLMTCTFEGEITQLHAFNKCDIVVLMCTRAPEMDITRCTLRKRNYREVSSAQES